MDFIRCLLLLLLMLLPVQAAPWQARGAALQQADGLQSSRLVSDIKTKRNPLNGPRRRENLAEGGRKVPEISAVLGKPLQELEREHDAVGERTTTAEGPKETAVPGSPPKTALAGDDRKDTSSGNRQKDARVDGLQKGTRVNRRGKDARVKHPQKNIRIDRLEEPPSVEKQKATDENLEDNTSTEIVPKTRSGLNSQNATCGAPSQGTSMVFVVAGMVVILFLIIAQICYELIKWRRRRKQNLSEDEEDQLQAVVCLSHPDRETSHSSTPESKTEDGRQLPLSGSPERLPSPQQLPNQPSSLQSQQDQSQQDQSSGHSAQNSSHETSTSSSLKGKHLFSLWRKK